MIALSLHWTGELNFKNAPDSPTMSLQSSAPDTPSPPQALAYAVMGCMAMDVLHVLKKKRQVPRSLTVQFEGERAEDYPRRFISMKLRFVIAGAIDPAIVHRAIDLSRDKYCSVWHSIRQDIPLETAVTIEK